MKDTELLRSWNNLLSVQIQMIFEFSQILSSNSHIFHPPSASLFQGQTLNYVIINCSVSNILPSSPSFPARFLQYKILTTFDSTRTIGALILHLFIALHLSHVLAALLSNLNSIANHFHNFLAYIFNSFCLHLAKPHTCWLGSNLGLLFTCSYTVGCGWRKMHSYAEWYHFEFTATCFKWVFNAASQYFPLVHSLSHSTKELFKTSPLSLNLTYFLHHHQYSVYFIEQTEAIQREINKLPPKHSNCVCTQMLQYYLLYIHIYIHTHIHIHIYTYTYIHTYINVIVCTYTILISIIYLVCIHTSCY